jgi:hypothetical protein
MYIALLDNCPYVWTTGWERLDSCESRHGSDEEDHIGSHTQAMSRQQERWGLESKKFTTKSLRNIYELRGNSTPKASCGTHSVFAAEGRKQSGCKHYRRPTADTVTERKVSAAIGCLVWDAARAASRTTGSRPHQDQGLDTSRGRE